MREVLDGYGMPVPQVDVTAAHSAALRLRRTGGAARSAGEQVEGLVMPLWWGEASESYWASRGRTSGLIRAVVDAAGLLNAAVLDYAEQVRVALPRWRQAEQLCRDLEARLVLAETDVTLNAGAMGVAAELERARKEAADAGAAFGDAVRLLESGARNALAVVDERPRSGGDQFWEGAGTFVRLTVEEPYALAKSVVRNPGSADDVAVAMGIGLWDSVTHPVRTARDMVGAQEFAEGSWGQGAGTTLATVIGLKGLGKVAREADAAGPAAEGGSAPSPHQVFLGGPGVVGVGRARRATQDATIRFSRNIQSPNAPRPRTQTLDEMAAGVDLSRSEHARLGHAISRHVDVDEDYLRYRLENGTIQSDLEVTNRIPTASSWSDMATAERLTTEAIRQNLSRINQEWGDSQVTFRLQRIEAPPDAGVVVRRGPHGELQSLDTRSVVVLLGRRENEIYVKTAYLSALAPETGATQ